MSDTFTIGTVKSLSDAIKLAPQPRRILAHLLKNKTISPLEASHVYHIPRLSDCILKIRRAGYKVVTEMREDEVGGQYGVYRLVHGKVN
jgi:hypothetical protein